MIDRDSVHEALTALYDNVRLAKTKIVSAFPNIESITALDECAEHLRSLLLEALDALRPARRLPFGSPGSRSYDVLRLRYVERMPIAQIEEELSLGRRQVFRDLEEAEVKLAEVLTSWSKSDRFYLDESEKKDLLSDELLSLVGNPIRVDLVDVLEQSLRVVRPLADDAGKQVHFGPDESESRYVLADVAILRQILVQLLCCALNMADTPVDIEVKAGEECATNCAIFRFAGQADEVQYKRLADAQRIAVSQGMECDLRRGAGPDDLEIVLRLKRGKPISVLVIEDNPGAVELYRRYLSAECWQVHSVSDPRVAPDISRELKPDVIVLDIMMPRVDGWSLLTMLRQQSETAYIPVLVCSIVEQPELASVLGAKAYLNKPVSQGEFLAALRLCLGESARYSSSASLPED